MAALDRNAKRLMKCFLGNEVTPLDPRIDAGDVKSARGPTMNRVNVFTMDISWTWNAAIELSTIMRFSGVGSMCEIGGSASTMDPMFEITISH